MKPRHDESVTNPHRLYRDRERAWLAGVCAGIAHYFGTRPWVIRLALVLLLFTPFNFVVGIGYVIAAFALQPMPERVYHSKDEEQFWRSVNAAPANTFGEVRHKIRGLEQRLRRLEAYVTSKQYEMDRELGGGHQRPYTE